MAHHQCPRMDRLHATNKEGVAYRGEDEKNLSPLERVKAQIARLAGRPCFAGLDLAEVQDLSALALSASAPKRTRTLEIAFAHWCPEEDIFKRSKEHRVPDEAWQTPNSWRRRLAQRRTLISFEKPSSICRRFLGSSNSDLTCIWPET